MNSTFKDEMCAQGISSTYFQQNINISQLNLQETDLMKYEVARLNTFFSRAPCDSGYYGPLAQAGFYCDSNHSIICSYCNTYFPKHNLTKNHIDGIMCINAKCNNKTTENVSLSPRKDAEDHRQHSDLPHIKSSLSLRPLGVETEHPNGSKQKSDSLNDKHLQQRKCQNKPLSVIPITREDGIVPLSDTRLQFLLQAVVSSEQNQIHEQRNYKPKEKKPLETPHQSNSDVQQNIRHALESLQCEQNERKEKISELQINVNQTNRWLDIIIDAYQKLVEQKHFHALQEEITNIKDIIKKIDPLQIIKEHQRARYDKIQTEQVLRKTTNELKNTLVDKRKLEQDMEKTSKELQCSRKSKENMELDLKNVSEELVKTKKGKKKLEQVISCILKMYKDNTKLKNEFETKLQDAVNDKKTLELQVTMELHKTNELQKMLESKLEDALNSKDELELALQHTVDAKEEVEEKLRSVSQALQNSLENNKQLTEEHTKSLKKAHEGFNKTSKELQEKVDRFTCQICCARPIQTILLPCTHACCEECTLKIMQKYECPFCRGKIKSYSTIILP